MYYLQSRYYNPEWGRFLNVDDIGGRIGELLSHNLFAYCGNNPIMRFDPYGHGWMDDLTSLVADLFSKPTQSEQMWTAFYTGIQSEITSFAQDVSFMMDDICRAAASIDRISEIFEESAVAINVPEFEFSINAPGLEFPQSISFDSKQLGMKWGKHKFDYPELNSYIDYKNLAINIFENPDFRLYDFDENEFYYIKENNLLRLLEDGSFRSLYPGAQSERVIKLFKN